MLQRRIWVYLIIASSMLMVVSGSLFMSLQHWVINDSSSTLTAVEAMLPSSKPKNSQSTTSFVSSTTQRIMLSTRWEKENKVSKSSPNVKTQITTNVSTRVSSMPNRVFDRFEPPSIAQQAFQSGSKTFSAAPAVYRQQKVLPTTTKHTKTISHEPSFVIYEDELVVEFPKDIATTQNIKKAVTRLLLSHHLVRDGNLLSNDRLNYQSRPYFYRKVLDENKQPIRYPKQAYDYINYLINNAVEEVKDDDGEFIEVHIPLHESGLKGPAKTYQAWVNNYANKFDINPALVYAVIETESGFNPKAVSSSNAIGLMQLKPDTAGKDVYQYVDQKPGQPSKGDLFDSEKNIRMGVAYLSLLKHDYLSDIHNDKIKQMVTISSYNGGIKTVLGLFGTTPGKAISRLNRLSPHQVYRTLRYQHQSDETRRYLDKVLRAESRYQALLDDA